MLERSEQDLADFVESSPIGMNWVDGAGVVLWANRAEHELLGYTRAEYVGRRIAEFHADPATIEEILARLGRGETLHNYEARLRAKDGSIRHVLISCNARFEGGRLVGSRSVTRDVTEWRLRERRFEHAQRFLAEASKILASSLDYEANLAAVARAAVGALGDWCVLFVPDGERLRAVEVAHDGSFDRDASREAAACLADPLEASGTGEVSVVTTSTVKDVRQRRLLTRVGLASSMSVPLLAHGRAVGVLTFASREPGRYGDADLMVAREIADRAAMALDNARLYREAERANRTKDEFLAMLGHELRNPLSPILTALELMRLRAGDVCDKERTIIERQVQHVVRLVDDLLDVSRLSRGKIELRRRPIEIAEVVAKAIEIASPLLEQRAHRLTTSIPQGGLVVDGDEARLSQVVANLLTNAAKYTERNGSIEVSAAREGSMAAIRVKDNGAGIALDLLPRIFDHFVQGRQTLSRSEGGLGLGLTIVKSLVELHGGSVNAFSNGPGSGTEFMVKLPLARSSARRAGSRASPPLPPAREDARRVLVIDDNRDAADMLAQALETLGHVTRVAYDGLAAVEAALSFRPTHALVDIGLPVLDGYEVARRLTERFGAGIVLIAVTGYGQESDRKQAREAGFLEHVVKPVDMATLAKLLETYPSSQLALSR